MKPMTSRSLIKRRELIASLGAAGFLAAPVFRDSLLEAQPSAFPTRFVVLFLAGGVYYPGGGEGYGNWTNNGVLSPLTGLQSDAIRFEGINSVAGFRNWTKSNEPHGAAMRALLTGDSSESRDGMAVWAQTDTIDQTIAASISNNVRFGSLQFGVSADKGAQIDQRRLFVKGGQALPPVDSPSTMFTRLFGDAVPAPAPEPTTPEPGPTPAPTPSVDTGARSRSILDRLIVEVTALKAVGGAGEQQKLDQHLTSLRELERALPAPGSDPGTPPGGVSQPGATPGVGCAAPALGNGSDIPAVLASQLDLLYQSLVCDLTRVAGLQILCSAQSGIQFPWLNVSEDHHTLEHCGTPCGSNLDKVQTYFTTQIAGLLNRMKATPEGNSNMLDNSLVLLVSELSNPEQHSHDFILSMTYGKAGGRVRPGRTIAYEEATHNLWLRSLLQVYGINVNSIGDADLNSGSVLSLS
jgi:hypothetical protein